MTFDTLQSLLDELANRGQHYAPIATLIEFEAEAPSALGIDIRFTDLDVLLARTDLKTSELKLSNIQAQHFATNLAFASPVLGSFDDSEGLDLGRRKDPRQAVSLCDDPSGVVPPRGSGRSGERANSGPANTELPVIIAGDLNTVCASGNPAENTAYQILLGSGFADLWDATHNADPGFTWPLHGEDPFTAFSSPTQRIDLVLVRGKAGVLVAELIGNTLADALGALARATGLSRP